MTHQPQVQIRSSRYLFMTTIVLNPSLGCPLILNATEKNVSFDVILASKIFTTGIWQLVPSRVHSPENLGKIPLRQTGVCEITQYDKIYPSSIDETRELISAELFNVVLKGQYKIYKVTLAPQAGAVLKTSRRKINGFERPTLYDLQLDGAPAKTHAICISEISDRGANFIHLTDLHLAKRNDLMESEITSANGPVKNFNNFNQRLRDFVKFANEKADHGQLDFILLGGDMVDFSNHGVSDEMNEADNNWQVFADIIAGSPREEKYGNEGLKVPVFTTTGNHDWRQHPYDPANNTAIYRISKKESSFFDYSYYDTVETLEAKKEAIYQKIIKEGSPLLKENIYHTIFKKLFKVSHKWQTKALVPAISSFLPSAFPAFFPDKEKLLLQATAFLVAAGVHNFINWISSKYIRTIVEKFLIPIEADVKSLHYYFLHINAYFNYAFSYGKNHFILMDTGPDCMASQYFWDNGDKKTKKLSVKDNLIGGSPDSAAFYPANEYYGYSQITWLEKILALAQSRDDAGRAFVCLHSPPVNIEKEPPLAAGQNEVLVTSDISYGTTNHFLSQFLHLCVGRKENDPGYQGGKIDIVFSGHTHREVEFRISMGENPLVFYGHYSRNVLPENFEDQKPFIVQTASCGPVEKGFPDPPYYRFVQIDDSGKICRWK